MCGIVGGVSFNNIVPVLVTGLKSLEYRGYDSAGVALNSGTGIDRFRAVGRVSNLEELLHGIHGGVGIAHTRWATHGAPAEHNAHPHISERDGVSIAVVHNGIIENHEELRQQLQATGFVFTSETDTEVIAHLIRQELSRCGNELVPAIEQAISQLEGAFALGILCSLAPDSVIAVRHGAPLLVGLASTGTYFASDASALIKYTNEFVLMQDGDLAVIQNGEDIVFRSNNGVVSRQSYLSELSPDDVALGEYNHYMQKEIFEQPGAVGNTLEALQNLRTVSPNLFGANASIVFSRCTQVLLLACGTSYHAALTAKYWLESVARIPTSVEIASEYRYREPVLLPNTLVITVSQSGETADTLAALEHATKQGAAATLSICNVPESALFRASDLKFLTRAGPEIGVASTKAFTTQLTALFLLTLVLAKLKGNLSDACEQQLLTDLKHLPLAVSRALQCEEQVKEWALRLKDKSHALFLGRGAHYPIAMEGALKMKELTYIHAEAYAAGELKHGPLALVDADMPIIAVAPNDNLLGKLKSNLKEVRARGGELYVFADKHSDFEEEPGVHVITLTDHAGLLSPILHVIPLQLLSYHTALARGADVDKPRNLAKSVTTE